jgi:hypothetical protein
LRIGEHVHRCVLETVRRRGAGSAPSPTVRRCVSPGGLQQRRPTEVLRQVEGGIRRIQARHDQQVGNG